MSDRDKSMASTEGLLDEYKVLREEMMWHFEHAQKTLTHFLVLVSALIGYGITQDAPLLFVIAWLINLEYWRQYIAHRGYVAKISRYIVTFIEPHAAGINWEGRVQEAYSSATDRGVQTGQGVQVRYLRTLLGPHSVLALACLVLTVYLGIRPSFGLTCRSTTLMLTATVLFHLLIVSRRLTPSWPDLRRTWDAIWREVASRQQCTKKEATGTTNPSS